jgi:hypothetical protein
VHPLSRTLALGAALLSLPAAACGSTSWCPASPSATYPDASAPSFLLALDAAGARSFSVRPSAGVMVLDAAPSGRGGWLIAGTTVATDVDLCAATQRPGHQSGFVGELGPTGELVRRIVLADVTSVDRVVATEGGPVVLAGFEPRRPSSVAERSAGRPSSVAERSAGCPSGNHPSVATLGFGYVPSEPFRRCQEIQVDEFDGFVSLLAGHR